MLNINQIVYANPLLPDEGFPLPDNRQPEFLTQLIHPVNLVLVIVLIVLIIFLFFPSRR